MALLQAHTRHILPAAAISLVLAGCQGCQSASAPPPEPNAQQPAKAHPDAPANHLIHESSPYLLQHAHNPVDWYPWGPEALEKAKREDKPIFLSIGYSACHWCHVMAHESFEDPEIARLMNASFVNIKVDREERPDLDEIYMQAVLSMTGSGGWPMSVWLTPDLKPFYGGTYFAPDSRYGRPGFRTLIEELSKAWRERRPELLKSGEALAQAIREEARLEGAAGEGGLRRDVIPEAVESLKRHFDKDYGGFGKAPKFPPSMDLRLLLREWRRTGDPVLLQMAETTLDRMARGGMYDQLGGGFHRYSTDGQWRVPHFEKMLYDNALLTRAYLEAWQATGKPQYARIAREICDYVLREMTSPAGGFYSSQDADSEGGEGRFFVWTPAEVETVLGKEDADLFCKAYDVTRTGNFEDSRSVLWLPHPQDPGLEKRLEAMRARLFRSREGRAKPGRDEKILADWNGLMIQALAQAGWTLDEPRYLEAAKRGADFCLTRMMKGGRLFHAYGRGEARLPAYLDDHAFLAAGCLALFEATGDSRWLQSATRLSLLMVEHFWDPSGGGFFFTANDLEVPIARTKHPGDHAIPSGNSVAAMNLLRLSTLTGDKAWREKAEKTILAFQGSYARQPRGFAEMLCTLYFATMPDQEILIAGPPGDPATKALINEVRRRFLPGAVILPFDPTSEDGRAMVKLSPLLAGRGLKEGKPAVYVCSGGVCQLPVVEPVALRMLLESLVKPAK